MNQAFRRILLTTCCIAFLLLPQTGLTAVSQHLAFTGGPNGGTFQYFSNGISVQLSRTLAGWDVTNLPSAGSVENIRRINLGEADFGVAYSGDVFLARNGQLNNDSKHYTNVQVLSFLYGAPVQLVVLNNSAIHSVADLKGKRIAVGGAGSGAAATAERYFKMLGIWDQLEVAYIGYNTAAAALGEKTIDAMWAMAGYPTAAIQQAAAKEKVRLLDTLTPVQQTGFFQEYPYYTPKEIPANTYIGQNQPVKSFQDAALWIAGKHVQPEVVRAALEQIYSPEGLAYMVKIKRAAKEMSIKNGLSGVVTQVHAGAKSFWQSKGLSFFPKN